MAKATTMAKGKIPKIDADACIGCSACISACPANVLELVEGKAKVANPKACTSCGACVSACPVEAIKL